MTTYNLVSETTQQLPKLFTSIVGAAIATFSIFVLMQKLIEPDDLTIDNLPTPVVIDPVFNIGDSKVIERSPQPKPIPEPKTMPKPMRLEPSSGEVNPFDGPSSFAIEKVTIGNEIFSNNSANSASRPIVRVPPSYPADAARDGVEGWVKLKFDVMPNGTVGNIQILDAQPKRIFNRAAKRALAKWKYSPSFENGTAIAQTGLEVVLDFTLTAQ